MHETQLTTFADLNLPAPILKALKDVGYETPSPIQAATIPPLLDGRDVARPGPDRHRQDRRVRAADPVPHRRRAARAPQALVLAPTRELALQVAEAFETLRRAHARTSTCCRSTAARATARSCRRCAAACTSSSARPGRVMDHLDKGTLDLSQLKFPRARRGRRDAAAWASSRTSRRSCARPRRRARSRCSRPPCRRRSAGIAKTYLNDADEITVKPPRPPPRPTSRQRYLAGRPACRSWTR